MIVTENGSSDSQNYPEDTNNGNKNKDTVNEKRIMLKLLSGAYKPRQA